MDGNIKHLVTETVIIDYRGYQFEITDQSIIRYGLKSEETSPGYLVSKHFDEIYRILYILHLFKDNLVKESMAQYWIEDQKEFDEAPSLEKCLDALEKQFSLMTEGRYDEYFSNCKARYFGEETENSSIVFYRLPYLMDVQDIFWHILDLRDGKWYGSNNPKYTGRRGIPRIETTGEKMYAEMLDLIWKMDNGEDYISPEDYDEMRKWEEQMKRVAPDITRFST